MKKVLILVTLLSVAGLLFAAYVQLGFTERYTVEIPTAYVPTAKIVEFDNMNYFGVKHGGGYLNHIFALKYGINNKYEFTLFVRGRDYEIEGYFPDSLYTDPDENIQPVYNDEVICINAKYSMFSETDKLPAIAVGMNGIDGAIKKLIDSKASANWAPYFVLSKSFIVTLPIVNTIQPTVHFGNGQRAGFHSFSPADKYFFGFFGALSIPVNDNITLTSEFRGANLNASGIYEWNKFAVKVGVVNFEEILMWDTNTGFTFFLNFKYRVDYFSKQEKDRHQNTNFNIIPSTDPSDQLLLDELRQIQEQRIQSEKELEELRKLLED